jgi:hypothetical protein
MTHTDYAGHRLANAVAQFLADGDRMPLKLVLADYWAAEERQREAHAANELQDGDQ